MTAKTLSWVSPVGDKPDQYGNYYVNVAFASGEGGYIASKQSRATAHQEALTALLNQEAEFTLEPKGKTQKGADKFKLVAYPGYEPSSSDGGRVSSQASWNYSEEGVRFVQERMDRRTALMQAVEHGPTTSLTRTLERADRILAWLTGSSGAPPSASNPGESSQADGAPEQRPTESLTDGEAGAAPVGSGEGVLASPSPTTTQRLAEMCKHPLESCTEDKPEGGTYRAGFVRCTLCEKVMPKNETQREEPE